MSRLAGKAILAAVKNNDVAALYGEEKEVFGAYAEPLQFVLDYYSEHRQVPSLTILGENFAEGVFDQETYESIDGATRHYVDEARSAFLVSELQNVIKVIAKGLSTGERSGEEVIARMSKETTRLSRLTTKAKDIDITDIDEAVRDFQKARELSKDGKKVGISTGIEAWDAHSPQGLLPGDNIILFGFSGRGKSWIADLVAANAYLQGKTVLLVSAEMTAQKQRERIFAILAGGNYLVNDIGLGAIPDTSMRNFAEDRLKTGGKIIVTTQSGHEDLTPNVILSKIEKHKPDLAICDYMQLFMDNNKTRDMTPRMLNLSREMKLAAVSSRIPIISISAVTDEEGNKRRNSPPLISQLAWSKGIEYDADIAVAIHRYENTNLMEIACRKNRSEELFNAQYDIDLSRGIFRIHEDEYEDS